ncbi:uncharacterized protein [Brachyistius frenatus]|uniref:uncharacterized protein n=2 Tax=Embiotocidae TaxID=50791 RepID=UPI0037E89FEC
MSTKWPEDDEEFRVGGGKGGLRAKPRFSFNEVKLLLEAVKRNRYIILRKFNQGVSAEAKKQTWAAITSQINDLGENHREVRQIMKKWADLKCDGKRRIAALRGPNGTNLRKKKLGPVERMVHKILMMSPRGDSDSDLDFGDDEEFSKFYGNGLPPNPSAYSYLSLTDNSLPGGVSFDISPPSSPEKDLGGDPFHSSSDFDMADDGEPVMDYEENDDPAFSSSSGPPPPPSSSSAASLDPLPNDAPARTKPVHTYSRNNGQSQTSSKPPGPSSPSEASTSSGFPPVSESDAASSSAAPPPPPSQSPTTPSPPPAPSSSSSSSLPPLPPASSSTVAANDATSPPAPSSTSIPPPPPPPASSAASPSAASTVTSAPSSNSHQPPPSSSAPKPGPASSSSGPHPSDPLPAGGSSQRTQQRVAEMSSQSLQQQRASRMLLTSVSRSLEVLAQSVQLLVESQQEFVQESLLLQRETVDILRDFSGTALTMLRDKTNGGQLATTRHHHHPASHL